MVISRTADGIEERQQQDQTNIKFPENRLLIDLCGEFDKNLAEIEQKLALQIIRRGNEIILLGNEFARSDGQVVLEALYARLENGKSLGSGDIDRELREVMGNKNLADADQKDNQVDLLKKPNL